MPLDVQIVSGATTYRLPADRISIFIGRNPLQSPISGQSPILADLGQFVPRITIHGTLGDAAATDGGVTVPSKVQLEDFVIDTYSATITFTVLGDNYVCKASSVTFDLQSARENFWDYSLVLVTQRRT